MSITELDQYELLLVSGGAEPESSIEDDPPGAPDVVQEGDFQGAY
jgi:hypothetical protein